MSCTWVGGCKNKVLRDELCCRHLKQKCSVCLEEVGSTNTVNTKRLSCGHSYHLNCILTWFITSDECPVCRCEQKDDAFVVFKHKVQDELRAKYKDAMESMEREVDNMRLESLASAAMGLGFLNINYAEIEQ
jgi:Ring finger domain